MKKITLLIASLITLSYLGKAQVLNQSANWPNVLWTVGGNYTAAGLLNNPTTSGNFAFDDDAAGQLSVTDAIFAESPIIDLTAANTAGENFIYFTGDYAYLRWSDTVSLDYWDADATNWIRLYLFTGNAANQGDYQLCLNTNYVTPIIDITNFTATQLAGFKYRINYDDDGAWNFGWCFGSPTIVSSPCNGPSNLTASNMDATSADLGWTEVGTATTWDIEYGPTGFGVGTGTAVNGVTSNPTNVTGLTAGDNFDFYVRSHCPSGGTSVWSGPFTFRAAFLAPYHEDFELLTIFGDWNMTNPNNNPDFLWIPNDFEVAPNNNSGPAGASGGNFYVFTDQSPAMATAEAARIESPRIDLSASNTPQLLFDYHMFGSDIDRLIVQVDSGNGFIDVDSIVGQQQTMATDAWVTRTVDLSSFTGTIVIAFEGRRNTGGNEDIAIDEVYITDCPQPIALATANIALTSVDFSWTEQGSATNWDIEWGPRDFVQGNGTTVAAVTTNPYNLTGLTAGTEYDLYVRANCGGASGSSEWSGPITFRTNCLAITAPYTESFENPADVLCWDIEVNNFYGWFTNTGGTFSINTGPADASLPPNANDVTYFYAEATQIAPGTTSLLSSPEIDISGLTSPELSFDYHMFGQDMGTLNILIDNGTGFTNVDNITGQQHFADIDPWSQRKVDLSAYTGTIRIGFEAIRGADFTSDIAIDDIEIYETVGIEENNPYVDLDIFPNPNSGVFNLSVQTSDVNELAVEVINVHGEVVFTRNNFDNVAQVNETIDLSKNAKGIYFINITTNKGVVNRKIVVQ